MMKKTLCVVLALVMLLGVLAACGGETTPSAAPSAAPSTAPESEPSAEPSGEPSAEPGGDELVYDGPEIEYTVNLNSSEDQAVIYTDVFERISARTGGKVTFIYYYSGSLLSASEALDGLGAGMCDFSDVTLTNFPDQFPYTQQVISYPFLEFHSFNMAAEIINDVIYDNELMMAEFEANNIYPMFLLGVWGTSMVMADDVEITTPDTVAGMKLVTSDPIFSKFLTDIGATPVNQPPTEYFSCLSNGVADGIVNGLYVVNIFGALAPAKVVYMFENSFTTGVRALSANGDTWAAMDPVLQQIFMEEMQGEELWEDGVAFWAASDQQHLDDAAEYGIPVKYVEGEDMQAWIDALKPYGDAELEDLYNQGYTEVYNVLEFWQDAIANYDGEY